MQRIPANGTSAGSSRRTMSQNLLIFGPSSIALESPRSSGSPHASIYPQEKLLTVLAHNARPGTVANQRRSQRVLLSVPVIVSGKRENGSSFNERTRTLVVNAHGALLLLRERVIVGQVLNITNVATGESLASIVKDINPGQHDEPEIGIEFSQPSARFWHVSFPPPDWSSRSPEAKRFEKPITPPANLSPEPKK
jgi:hypothetical protein